MAAALLLGVELPVPTVSQIRSTPSVDVTMQSDKDVFVN